MANVVRTYGVFRYDPDLDRVKLATEAYTYGQAMNTATAVAEHYPKQVVWMESRIIIQNPWEDVDFEAEEYRNGGGFR